MTRPLETNRAHGSELGGVQEIAIYVSMSPILMCAVSRVISTGIHTYPRSALCHYVACTRRVERALVQVQ